VLDEFWRRDLPRTRRAFVEFYRPCEAIFAVGAQLCDRPEHEQHGRLRGVVGAQKASPYADQELEAFDPQFSYMDSDLGGYGLYYATTIAAMGLIAPALAGTNLSFDAPTPEGRIVADGFRSAVADTVYYRDYFADSSRPVPYEVVRDYIRRACLCQLQTAAAPDRELLRDVFLHAGAEDAATTRQLAHGAGSDHVQHKAKQEAAERPADDAREGRRNHQTSTVVTERRNVTQVA
jgi:hypothetical protein